MFARIRELLFNLTAVIIALVVLSSLLIASYELESWPFGDHRTFRERYQFRRVERASLEPFLSAPGRVESAKRTVVRCELENMAGSTGSASMGASSSTVIWLIPEGSAAKKGDVLARLDGSTYEEMLRQQIIVVEQAKASHLQAQLNHEIAKIALHEYIEGTAKELVQEMNASIYLARTSLNQAQERLEWTKRMNKKGYASVAQMVTDKQTVMTSDLALQRQVAAFDLFERFTLPKTQMTLQADITTSRTTLESEQVKLNRQVERLALLKRQVDRCTIRAPHDGVVFYYFSPNPRRNQDNANIEEGMAVRQKQELFYLPDLTEMEVQVILNESVVNRVSPGLRATVEFEGLPHLSLEGQVESISQIPNRENPRGEDVRYFIGDVKLDHSSEGLKPGMTAVVTFKLPRRNDVIAVPHEAVLPDRAGEVCFVAVGEHLERRPVKVGRTTPELIEITEGLQEGEEIVLDPPGRDTRPRTLAGFDARPWPAIDRSHPAPATKQAGPRGKGAFGAGGGRRNAGGQPGGGGQTRKSRKRAAPDE